MAVIERTKNATRNIVFGVLLKLFNIGVPFLMRTAIIYIMGVQYLGLNSLFASVLQVLNLAELGVGTAISYCMYRPVAEDDTDTVCALMALYRKYYRIIGLMILVVGLLITPSVPRLIKTDTIPEGINVYVLYLLNLVITVISYLFFAYKNCLLNAHQRNDINSKVTMVTSEIQYVAQFLVLYFFHSYYGYTIIILLIGILSNIILSKIVDRMYPQYRPRGEVSQQLKNDIRGKLFPLMSVKLAMVIVNSADTLVISKFLGLTDLAIYNNYFYIMNSVLGFIIIIYSSIQAGIGNALVVDSREKIIEDFFKFHFMNNWLVVFCTACLLCLYQPFMELWVGEKLMLSNGMVVLFVVYFYASAMQRMVVVYKDAAGIWREDMVRCYISCITNAVLNVILVQYIGLYGVIGSSVFSTVLLVPWMGFILFKVVFHEKGLILLKTELFDSIKAIGICSVTYVICILIPNGFWGLIIRAIICIFIPNLLMLIIYRNNQYYKMSVAWLKAKFLGGRK